MRLELDAEERRLLAREVADLVLAELRPLAAAEDGWLDGKAAAEYLGISPAALAHLAKRGQIAYEQEAPGCKRFYRRTDLEAYRRGERRLRHG
jgi:Helix-turn-helix domain